MSDEPEPTAPKPYWQRMSVDQLIDHWNETPDLNPYEMCDGERIAYLDAGIDIWGRL
jgi:hypothetical protein